MISGGVSLRRLAPLVISEPERPDRTVMMYRVRIIRSGQVLCVVDIAEHDVATEWAMDYMRLNSEMDSADGIWAATLEYGHLFVDPIGNGRPFFYTEESNREGLVLDHSVLHDPSVDVKFLFGLGSG